MLTGTGYFQAWDCLMYLLHTIMSYMSSEYSPAMCVFSLPVQVEAMAKSLFWGVEDEAQLSWRASF